MLFLTSGRSSEWADKWPSGGGNGAGHSGNGGTGGGFKDNNSDDEVKIENRVAKFYIVAILNFVWGLALWSKNNNSDGKAIML